MTARFQKNTWVSINGNSSMPTWDATRRVLEVGGIVIKRFRWPAANQTVILEAFENSGWPSRISDPLPQHPRICPKVRLHDTIKCLNRNFQNEVIKFRGDGTGRGVLVEVLEYYRIPQTATDAPVAKSGHASKVAISV